MIYLADTNVLLRFADRTNPVHPVIRDAVRKLRNGGHGLAATSQNFIEFWNVANRPAANNGLGYTLSATHRLLRLVERIFPLLPDIAPTYREWRRVVVAFGVSGVQVFDARLVASMITHGVTHILTLNTADFVRYASAGIVAVDPATV